jgi:hypothetical protein
MRAELACVACLLAWVSAGAEAEPTEESGPGWTTTIGSMNIGSGDETATFSDVRSTCNMFRLALAFGSAAGEVRQCLSGSETRRVFLEVEGGRVTSSKVDPDDEAGRCVATALADAHLEGLTCTLEATVSR